MPALTLANLLAWAIQAAVVIAVGAFLCWLLPLSSPRLRLGYWRALLLVVLLLPLLQVWVFPLIAGTPAAPGPSVPFPATMSRPETGSGGGTAPALTATVSAIRTSERATSLIGLALLAGIAARLAWLSLGIMTLARLRTSASAPLESCDPVTEARVIVGADAEFRASSAIARPVSFGVVSPVVVVPAEFTSFDVEHQRAIACHELLHVRKRHWMGAVAEQVLLSIVWFHPALWWLLDRIELAREQVVDREVVRLLGARKPYLNALLRLATPVPRLVLTPASMFLRRPHLSERVALLLKEVSMSKSRVAVSLAVMAFALVFAAHLVASSFPIALTPAAAPVRPGVQVVGPPQTSGSLQVTSKVDPVFPSSYKIGQEPPIAVVRGSIGFAGEVTQAEAVAGPPELAAAAAEALQRWVFTVPDNPPVAVKVGFNFASVAALPDLSVAAPAIRVGGNVKPPIKVRDVRPLYPKEAQDAKVQGVVIMELTIDPSGLVRDGRILRTIPMLDAAALQAALQWQFTPTLLNGTPVPVIMTVTCNFTLS